MTVPQKDTALAAGFGQPIFDSQSTFRAILDAMARPARILTLPVLPNPVGALGPAAAAIALTLVDSNTRVWLDLEATNDHVMDFLKFHCGCPIVQRPEDADFAFVASPQICLPLWSFGLGTPEYPDRSTTVILQVDELDNGGGPRLTGPGIETENRLSVSPLTDGFWDQAKSNHSFFPLGVDVLFACGDRIACLPRSTVIGV